MGCVPSAAVAVSGGGVSARGCLQGVSAWGMSARGRVSAWRGVPRRVSAGWVCPGVHHPPVNRMTKRDKIWNIYLICSTKMTVEFVLPVRIFSVNFCEENGSIPRTGYYLIKDEVTRHAMLIWWTRLYKPWVGYRFAVIASISTKLLFKRHFS